MEDAVQKGLGLAVRPAAVEQGVVQVGGPVVEGGEEEAVLRRGHGLGDAAVELVVPGEVPQAGLALLHRADGAQQVGEHRVAVQLQVVLALDGDIVGVVCQQQQVVALEIQSLGGLFVKGPAGLCVLQARAAQGHEQPVLLAVRHLLGGEHQVDEVFPQPAGERLPQQGEVLLGLL